MNRKDKYSEYNLRKVIKNSNSIKSALENLGLRAAGGNYRVFHKYVDEYKIDTSHFEDKIDIYKRTIAVSNANKKIPTSDILVENSSYPRHLLKKRLFKEDIKQKKCEIEGCEQGEYWMGKKISLILDHINGIHNDNRIENLRIVCPNCNATLDTHCKGSKKSKKQILNEERKEFNGLTFFQKESAIKKRKVKRPSYDILLNEVEKEGYSSTGRKYGVSDNAIRKWIKFYQKKT